MNIDVLRKAEANFFASYPGGFNNPDMIAIGKKHKMPRMEQWAREGFARTNFDRPGFIVEEAAKLVSRVKPTTAKLIIDKLELDLDYKPVPSWEFYKGYRKAINELKAKVDKSIAPNNPAFCGFLMMSL